MKSTSAEFRTNWGSGWVFVAGGRLVGVEMPAAPLEVLHVADPPLSPRDPTSSDEADGVRLALEWAGQLEAYFEGRRLSWSEEEVDLESLGLSAFREDVYQALLRTHAGTTITYGELAAAAGHPGAGRAVGRAMAANPLPIVVPCHRVVRADGALGGYGQCDAWKPLLLAHEGLKCVKAVGVGSRSLEAEKRRRPGSPPGG